MPVFPNTVKIIIFTGNKFHSRAICTVSTDEMFVWKYFRAVHVTRKYFYCEISTFKVPVCASVLVFVHVCTITSLRWAHIVCCLYTPGVTFIEPSQLNCVVLDEILPLRWGQKACQLCSDPSMAKTGVCVQCDVGMCRSAFHVTWCVNVHKLQTCS